MPASKKRTANEVVESSGPTTRGAKAAKTDKSPSRSKAGAKKGGPKANLATSEFISKALPLHINITHTPPTISTEAENESVPDPGLIGTTTLLPSSFSTGSYGWKGNKRIMVELLDGEGKKEKVHVMLTVNATVMGSKNVGKGEGDGDHEEKVEEVGEGADDDKEVKEGDEEIDATKEKDD